MRDVVFTFPYFLITIPYKLFFMLISFKSVIYICCDFNKKKERNMENVQWGHFITLPWEVTKKQTGFRAQKRYILI